MFLRNILMNLVYYARNTLEYFFGYKTWEIIKVEMTYEHSPVEDEDDFIFDPFWDTEIKYWDDNETTGHYMNVTREYNLGLLGDVDIPVSVDDIVLCVSYIYNRRKWKFFTRNMDFSWPPKISDTMKFTPPYVKAELLDKDGNVVRDVTGKFKRYAGPYGNFYNEPDISPNDLFPDVFHTLRVQNILNTVTEYSLREPIRIP